MKPGISIVICCYNSSDVIVPTLESVIRQDFSRLPHYELILVDNRSTDNTAEIAKKICRSSNFPIRVVNEDSPGLIFARKKGVMESSCDIVFFVDDDNILQKDWVNSIYHIFNSKTNVGAVGGLVKPLLQGQAPKWFKDYMGVYACGLHPDRSGLVTRSRMMLVGAGLAFRTHILKTIFSMDVPLYLVGRTGDSLLRGEDDELCKRCILLGWELWFEKSLTVQHSILETRLNWDYVLKARQGGGAADIILHLYRQMITGEKLRSYKALANEITIKWRMFWKSVHQLDDLMKEGHRISFQYAFLTGMTQHFLTYDQRSYNDMCNNLLYAFKKPSHILSEDGSTHRKRDLIVTISDNNFVRQAKQLFSSIYHNAGWSGDYLLLSNGIPESDLKWFKEKGILVKNCKPLQSPEVCSSEESNWPTAVLSTIYLFRPEFKKWRTVIYLDADMIVCASLNRLTHTKQFAAVQGLFSLNLKDRLHKSSHELPQTLYSSLMQKYGGAARNFNGGIIVFNTDVIEDKTIDDLKNLLVKYRGPLTRNEETVLNFYFHNKWEKLPSVYNVYANSFNKPEKAKGIILHFMRVKQYDSDRPWSPKNPFYKLWMENLKKADQINLTKRPPASEEWTSSRIFLYSLVLKLRNTYYFYAHSKHYSPLSRFLLLPAIILLRQFRKVLRML